MLQKRKIERQILADPPLEVDRKTKNRPQWMTMENIFQKPSDKSRTQQPFGDAKMRGRADRKELCQPFDDAKEKRQYIVRSCPLHRCFRPKEYSNLDLHTSPVPAPVKPTPKPKLHVSLSPIFQSPPGRI